MEKIGEVIENGFIYMFLKYNKETDIWEYENPSHINYIEKSMPELMYNWGDYDEIIYPVTNSIKEIINVNNEFKNHPLGFIEPEKVNGNPVGIFLVEFLDPDCRDEDKFHAIGVYACKKTKIFEI